MRRAIACALVAALVVACTAQAEELPETTTTTTSTTTTTISSTTTTTTVPPPAVTLAGAPPELEAQILALYAADEDVLLAPEALVESLAGATPAGFPLEGEATVATWQENIEIGVVTVGDDVTLAVADPDWRIVGGWWPDIDVGEHLGGFPKIVAVVGSDARPHEDRERTRTDSIHFVGLDGEGGAAVVGVPRDAWVGLPGRGNSRINAALVFGGPDLMMDTFSAVTGLEFEGYLLTGFAGFESLIAVLGGLELDVPMRLDDTSAKARLEAGLQLLEPAQALAFTRTRKTLPRGDFQRQEHGGMAIAAAQIMVRALGPLALPGLLEASEPHFSTDLAPEDLLVLAAAVIRVDPELVDNVVAPGRTGRAGSASVVFLTDGAADLWEDLADGRLD